MREIILFFEAFILFLELLLSISIKILSMQRPCKIYQYKKIKLTHIEKTIKKNPENLFRLF